MKKVLFTLLSVFVIAACSKSSDEPKPSQGDLVARFSSESFSCAPGEHLSLPFTLSNLQGAELSLSATSSSSDAKVTVQATADYQDCSVEFDAPEFSDGTPVTVTLTVSDPANSRRTTAETSVNVAESNPLTVALTSDIRSMAVRPSGTFSLNVAISGATSGDIKGEVSDVTGGWTVSFEPAEGNTSGVVKVTAPSALTSSLSFTLTVTDSRNRSAKLDVTLAIVESSTTADAANSYMVRPGSTLTIKGVEGNSTDELDFNNASLVWQDDPGLIRSVSGNGDDKVIVVVLAPGKTGNAVVAARKDTTIVWSWHVWVTEDDPSANAMEWRGDKGTYHFLDRNLGATSAAKNSDKAIGFMYQWGRKDPFTGGDGVVSVTSTKLYDIDGNQVYIETEERPVYADHVTDNLRTSIEHPDVFYWAPSSSWPVVDWLTDEAALQNNDLWGGVSGLKTKYDPCPSGWKVPGGGDPWGFRKLYKKAGSLRDSGAYDPSYPWFIENSEEESIGFRYRPAGSDREWWFPLSGNRDTNSGEISSTGGSAIYNTADVSNTTALLEIFAFGNPASESVLNRSYGSAVRCIKE